MADLPLPHKRRVRGHAGVRPGTGAADHAAAGPGPGRAGWRQPRPAGHGHSRGHSGRGGGGPVCGPHARTPVRLLPGAGGRGRVGVVPPRCVPAKPRVQRTPVQGRAAVVGTSAGHRPPWRRRADRHSVRCADGPVDWLRGGRHQPGHRRPSGGGERQLRRMGRPGPDARGRGLHEHSASHPDYHHDHRYSAPVDPVALDGGDRARPDGLDRHVSADAGRTVPHPRRGLHDRRPGPGRPDVAAPRATRGAQRHGPHPGRRHLRHRRRRLPGGDAGVPGACADGQLGDDAQRRPPAPRVLVAVDVGGRGDFCDRLCV